MSWQGWYALAVLAGIFIGLTLNFAADALVNSGKLGQFPVKCNLFVCNML